MAGVRLPRSAAAPTSQREPHRCGPTGRTRLPPATSAFSHCGATERILLPGAAQPSDADTGALEGECRSRKSRKGRASTGTVRRRCGTSHLGCRLSRHRRPHQPRNRARTGSRWRGTANMVRGSSRATAPHAPVGSDDLGIPAGTTRRASEAHRVKRQTHGGKRRADRRQAKGARPRVRSRGPQGAAAGRTLEPRSARVFPTELYRTKIDGQLASTQTGILTCISPSDSIEGPR